jgi:hypothetical protein
MPDGGGEPSLLVSPIGELDLCFFLGMPQVPTYDSHAQIT